MYNIRNEDHVREIIGDYSREMLEDSYVNLWFQFLKLKDKHSQYVSNVSWEHTARQQERSGGWM